MAGDSSPVMLDGRVYVVDDRGKLYIYEAETGKLIGRKALGTMMRSTPLVADGKIYLCTNDGQWYILRPTEKGVEVVHHVAAATATRATARRSCRTGGFICRRRRRFTAWARPDVKPSADPLPPQPQEAANDDPNAGVGASRAVRRAAEAGRQSELPRAVVQRERTAAA